MNSSKEVFAPLIGAEFKVRLRFDLALPLSETAALRYEEYAAANLVYRPQDGVQKQIFEPVHTVSRESISDTLSGRKSSTLFPGGMRRYAKEIRLVFRRRTDYKTQKPNVWMIAARHGEANYFNALSAFRQRQSDPNYLTLTYWSRAKGIYRFAPVFLKTFLADGYFFFEIDARDAGNDILVTARRVEKEVVPQTLLSVLKF